MSNDENYALERLREELHEYHVDVQKLIIRCESCRADVEQIHADVYGLPGSKETNPGLMGEVAELRGSRRRMLLAMRCVWGFLMAIAGAVATALLRNKS
jgi:hypothetical protein